MEHARLHDTTTPDGRDRVRLTAAERRHLLQRISRRLEPCHAKHCYRPAVLARAGNLPLCRIHAADDLVNRQIEEMRAKREQMGRQR
jgi:hypothetical protein